MKYADFYARFQKTSINDWKTHISSTSPQVNLDPKSVNHLPINPLYNNGFSDVKTTNGSPLISSSKNDKNLLHRNIFYLNSTPEIITQLKEGISDISDVYIDSNFINTKSFQSTTSLIDFSRFHIHLNYEDFKILGETLPKHQSTFLHCSETTHCTTENQHQLVLIGSDSHLENKTHMVSSLLERAITLIDKGIKPENIHFRIPIDVNYITEIVTLKALHNIWQHLLYDFYGRSSHETQLFTAPIESMQGKTLHDTFKLIPRTIQSFASILGGANGSIYMNNSSSEEQRLSLNINRILIHESNLQASLVTDCHSLKTIEKDLVTRVWSTIEKSLPPRLANQKHQTPTEKTSNKSEELYFLTNTQPGFPPYLKGPYPSMYLERPWTIRQYAGFSTAEASNSFYKDNLKKGQKGLSVAFDLPTHRGYDSDHERVLGDVGKAGVAIDSVEDMKVLFQDIPLDKTSVSMTMNGAVIPIMAFFIVAAEEQSINPNQLRGTIQNDILKEFMVRNTYIYPPKPSMHIVSDIFEYTSKHMPLFNSISISGYHMHEAGAPAELELAYTLADGIEYIRSGLSRGIPIDNFAPRLSFFWGIGMNYATEVAKLRAGRVLWANLVAKHKPNNPKSSMLRTHCQTSGWSLTAQEPQNNIVRTTIEALSAVHGQTQSLHTNAMDEAIALPSVESAEIARNTQLFLQRHAGTTDIIDIWSGSNEIESLTKELVQKAWEIIEEIEELGGMTNAIDLGIPKLKIEEAATKKQAAIDQGNHKIIGLNDFLNPKSTPPDTLEVDNEAVRAAQLNRLKTLKSNRDNVKVVQALKAIEESARTGKGNLLELSIEAARLRATLGEISLAMETVFGRHSPKSQTLTGVYANSSSNNAAFKQAQIKSNEFAQLAGRRPRILVAKVGQDGHDRGANFVASSLADIGFDVDIGPLFQTPKEVVKQAIENDVHLIGISSQAGAHKTLVREIRNLLLEQNSEDIQVVVGGVIPEKDYPDLIETGVKAIFGPGTNIATAALELLDLLIEALPDN